MSYKSVVLWRHASHLKLHAEHHAMRFLITNSQTNTDNRIQSNTMFVAMIDQGKIRGIILYVQYTLYNIYEGQL